LGDPFVLVTPTGYVVYGTDDWPAHIPTATSPDLVHWTEGPDAIPNLPTWTVPDPTNSTTWAPAVLQTTDKTTNKTTNRTTNTYVLYVAVLAAPHLECIAAATATAPTGPFTDALGKPLVCQRSLGGSIDPSVVRATDGLHLLWKSGATPAEIWEQPLKDSGLALTGKPTRLLTADQPWQAGVIENPAMLQAPAGDWLFYSGNVYDRAAYGTGVAWCATVSGPCFDRGEVLATSAGDAAPGGLETFRDLSGQVRAVFATWTRPPRNGRYFCCRALNIATITTTPAT
jgi:hypothetical protein